MYSFLIMQKRVSPLLAAVQSLHLPSVRWLIELGADANFAVDGIAPVVAAIFLNDLLMVRYFVEDCNVDCNETSDVSSVEFDSTT